MKPAENPLLQPFRGKPAILDANLLLLLWCASFDRTLIHTFKRLNSFEDKDVDLLNETLQIFSSIRTTPHVLTEVSNLANSLPRWIKENWYEHFAKQILVISEEWVKAATVSESPYMYLGLTDVALKELAATHVILTIDFPLSNLLETYKLNVINFTYLRDISQP
jgi:hypothetical protein